MSVEAALAQWNAAGVPYKQLSVGAAFYGWTARTTSNTLTSQYVSFAKTQIKGDQYDSMSADPCPGSPKSYSGEMQWRSVASAGIDASKNGWKTHFDTTTETPYAINAQKKQIVTYDNGTSFFFFGCIQGWPA
jgi:chitinase